MLDALLPLLVVVGLLVGCWWVVRRLTPITAAGRGIRVLSRTALAPRQGVAVLEVHGVHQLVSWGDGGVRSLGILPPPTEEHPAEEGPSPGGFLKELRERLPGGRIAPLLLLGAMLLSPPTLQAQQDRTPTAPRAAAIQAPQAPTVRPPEAPTVNLRIGQGDGALNLSGSVGVAVMLGLMTLLPAAIMVMTSFTRIIVVLGFLRSALGTPTAPPTQVLVIMAIMLTGVVMRPTLEQVNTAALAPYLRGDIAAAEAYSRGLEPLRGFMLANVQERDLALFAELSQSEDVARVEDLPTVAITGAFMTSELRAAFLMGFLLFVPFLVIDLIVASVLMSLGMFMLPPVMVSLPFKLLLFVLADGWVLLIRGLVASYQVAGG